MVILEIIAFIAKWIAFWVARFLVWIVTGRGCRRCKHRYNGWAHQKAVCTLNWNEFVRCEESVHRCKFAKEKTE